MNLWKVGLFICLRIGLALSYHKEVTQFCYNNGMNFLSFWGHEKSLSVKRYLLQNSFTNNLRSQIVDDLSPFSFLSSSNIDTLIFISNKFHFVLEAIHKHKIQKSILVIRKNETKEFQNVAGKFAKNCYFYLLQYDYTELSVWYTVIILNNYSQIIMNKIEFDPDGKIIEDYDFQGIELVTSTLAWDPIISYTKCDNKGRNCDSYGMLIDLIEMWSKDYNFTWDVFTGYPDNDWGMAPKSGKNQILEDLIVRMIDFITYLDKINFKLLISLKT